MEWKELIEQQAEVMGGKHVFKGTRLTVESVLERLADGWSEEELLKAFPRLTKLHIDAARKYAAVTQSRESS